MKKKGKNKGNGNGNGRTHQDPRLTMIQMWGSHDDVQTMAHRLQATHPTCRNLPFDDCMAVAQRMIAVGANIYRDELQVWKDSEGKLHIGEGYKLLVRWAKRICQYSEKWEPLPASALRKGDIGLRCFVLRHDARLLMETLLNAEMPYQEVLDLVWTYADGIVRREETVDDNGHTIDPATGWSWEQTARKRALCNTLKLSHGSPSMAEIAAESWMVGNMQTTVDDWQYAWDTYPNPDGPPGDRELTAQLSARTMQSLSDNDGLAPEEALENGRHLLRGDDEGEEI